MTDTRFASRKFILAVLALVSATVLVWFGRIDGGVFSAVVIASVGAYMTANWASEKDKADKK